RARQPRVDVPSPPERREDEHPAKDSSPRRVVREQLRDLGDREYEDQVEEELERGDLVLGELELRLGVGHAPTLAAVRDERRIIAGEVIGLAGRVALPLLLGITLSGSAASSPRGQLEVSLTFQDLGPVLTGPEVGPPAGQGMWQ